ncbi:hypothetical protein KIH39_06280 [Telmatocola sphagniphila]|uniref:NADH:ubiquinone oxidoreductase-like 20kDa subunit domain-containing protein n=1 Tax=Telmatocola sphagniphila TaxID=1123043 RepID=A0A8E6EUB6_9BACT|nr:hypothetical protein [Telmatocola sphagniphila]QVL33514.1 hypothetical protein KIH39_06280 [Telmatocola sphagniphila]
MRKPKLATCSLAGCFGCHMSLLDIDEKLLDLIELIDLDKSPLNDKKEFDQIVDIGLVEGGCSSEHNVHVLKNFRKNCRILVAVGACALTGGVPSFRNMISLTSCLEEAYTQGPTHISGGEIPDDPDLPRLLDRVYPCHEVVKIDHFLPGCPPSADAIWFFVTELLAGRSPRLPPSLLKYE